YIVAIGASAGGLEAIHEFFDYMPDTGNMAFIIIQHLSPDYKSLLVELVAKHTSMQVQEAQHGTVVEKNCIYVIPNNKLLTIVNGHLQLIKKKQDKQPNTAIDVFLKSLAEDQGSKAIAVVLSGTGTDGTRGVEAIQQHGGIVLVQDPTSAKFDGMPNSAIAAGFADFILSPEAMPEEIINYVKERPYKKLFNGKLDEQALPEVLNLIEKHCGYDFHNYKTPTIIRRISRRMNQLGKKKFDEYLVHLRQHGEECKILGKEFLIGVTKFFRDTTAFEIFKNEVVSEVVRTKENHDTLKVWITACSTGQEAYSIAILINEALHQIGKTLDVKIFATDIDADAIEFASKGVYSISALQELNEEWVNRYFIRQEDKIVVVPHIRKQIVFARHNILKDPPFIKNDIVTCRNMLIYMNNVLQRKVLQALQYSLNVGGFLFLGPSEIPGSISHLLTEVNNKWKIYRKTGVEHAYQPMRYDSVQGLRNNRDVKEPAAKEGYMAKGLSEEMKNLLTEEFRFAAIYIDTNYEIKEAVGDFRHYLSLPQKIINLNVLKMVNQDMTVALNTAIRKATKENKKITLNNIRIQEEGKEKFINLYVKPAQAKEGYLMIVFGEGNEVTLAKPSNENLPFQTSDTASYINELEEELKETKGHLQMVVESLETTNEELQSSNEELLSANEELQSSNEELQSLNEELHTLNTEHQLRIKELIELNDDLNNYFQSTEIGQVFVDANYRIRKFNPATAHF
ncbi:MAG: chemotaxis protein, partial [Flavisolibacter sp.]|nr:chemotaxis protein [Flavisolibacter sp.]